MNRMKIVLSAAAVVLAGMSAGAWAQAEEGVVAAAKKAGAVGEHSDGYLGFAKSPSAEVKAAVNAVNIKRREIYTNIAAAGGKGSVEAVATARGCEQLAKRVAPGEAYRIGNGAWQVRGSAAIGLPPICG
jgi:uncharacterized protein